MSCLRWSITRARRSGWKSSVGRSRRRSCPPRRAEKVAGVEPLDGSLWHAYRRKWATERKHLPDVDVANAGGWKTLDTMKLSYQHADAETMFTVVTEPRRLRQSR